MQGGTTQRGTPGYNGTPGYCVVHQIVSLHLPEMVGTQTRRNASTPTDTQKQTPRYIHGHTHKNLQ